MPYNTFIDSPPLIVNPLEFYNPPHDSLRPLPIFYHRDAFAGNLLFGALAERGRRLGEPLFNMPPVANDLMREGDWCHDGEVELGPNHEVLITTRLPLDDEEFDEQKQVILGYTKHEAAACAAAREYFKLLTRSQLILAPQAAGALRSSFELRQNIEFYQRVGARYREFVLAPRKERKVKGAPDFLTAGFVLRKRNFNEDGATLLSVFGMDGSATLLWTYLLARFHTDWLFEDGFRMVEISGPRLPARASDMTFAAAYEVQELLHID